MAQKNNIPRRKFLDRSIKTGMAISVAPGLLADFPGRCAENNARKPNLLFIFSDQHRAFELGCYGQTQINTPNFDSFVNQGMILENAISPTPVCCPYRASLMSGLYAHHNGVITNQIAIRENLPCIGRLFKDSGYVTGYIGKWHLGPVNIGKGTKRLGFDDLWAVNVRNHIYSDWRYLVDKDKEVFKEGYVPELQTDLCIDFIDKHKDKNWCLFLSWGPPHTPYKSPPEYDHYKDLKPRANVGTEKSKKFFAEFGPQYYGLIESLDAQFGRIMNALDKMNLTENTIVVYTSDHGDMLGSHNLKFKRFPHEESIKVPFLIRFPNKIKSGTKTDLLFSAIDIFPTMAGLAGIDNAKIPSGLDGKDLSPALSGKKLSGEPEYVYLSMHYGYVPFPGWRGIRTKDYLYTRTKNAPWLLFNIKEDKYQLQNLIEEPEKKKITAEMDNLLSDIMKKVGDSWDIKTLNGDIDSWNPPGPKFKNQNLGGSFPME